MSNNTNISRRQFIKTAGLTAGAALIGSDICKGKVYRGKTKKFSTGSDADITFFVTSDLHYGRSQIQNNELTNKNIVTDMNTMVGNNYPASVGGKIIDQPRGVLVAGDITDYGKQSEWDGYDAYDGFIDDFGTTLNYPIYEGYGNHDCTINGSSNYTKEQVKLRNQTRPGITAISSNGYHYSWQWDNIHFVNLNLYPGPQGGRTNEAEGSIDFLIADLAANVGNTGKKVVIYHHFGMDSNSTAWWTESDRDTYYQAIKNYDVVAIFHGHSHVLDVYQWKGIDIYDIGTGLKGEWAVVNITEAELIFASRNKYGWHITAKKDLYEL